jgi:hypothetical protein
VSATGKTLHLERLMRSWDADIYLMGHSHLKYGLPVDKHETVIKPAARATSCGARRSSASPARSWTATSSARSTYVEEKALAPVPTGGLLIEARPSRRSTGWRWDMFVTA